LHLVAHNFSRWFKHYKICQSNVLHPSPSYLIIQVLLVFQKIMSCTPKPSTFPLSITFYENKCLRKRLNWSRFPLKNKLLIYLLNPFLEKHLNIWDRNWELSLSHFFVKSACLVYRWKFKRFLAIREFHEEHKGFIISMNWNFSPSISMVLDTPIIKYP